MQKIKDYLTSPTTWITLLVFVFWLGGLWTNTNNRIAELEKRTAEIDTVKVQMYEIQTTLSQIQTDISWIKKSLSN